MANKRFQALHSVFHFPRFILLTIVVMIGLMTSYYTLYVPEEVSVPEIPAFEIYPDEKIPSHKPILEKPKEAVLPKVAIIIDDIGYDRVLASKFLNLNVQITFSVLPQSPFGKRIIKQAREKGIEIMLHLPMEPLEYPMVKPGPGAIYKGMSPDEIIAQLNRHLDAMPKVLGVNNHMGSKITSNFCQMHQILSILKKRNLFFIDSFTNIDSLCSSSARLLQIPFAKRDVFLDHSLNPELVRKQIKQLIRVANAYGEAVGIGHPHTVTYKMLKEALPELRQKVRLVPASKVVHSIG